MNFTSTFSLGDLLVALSILVSALGGVLGILAKMRRLERSVDLVMVEHEMLIVDYCSRTGIDISKLPTRMRYWEQRRDN